MADLKREERRGEDARQVLEADVYKDAYKAIRDRIISQLELADLPTERRQRLNDLLVAHAKVKQYMEQTLISGTMAAQEIDRQATLREKAGTAWQRLRA